MRKMWGVGTNGAATMIGECSRVVTNFNAAHCSIATISHVKKFNTILQQLFDFFITVVRRAGLKTIQCLLQQKGSLVARWPSIEHSVSMLRDCFASVIISLQREEEEGGDAKAFGLQVIVTEHRTMLLI